MATFYIHLEFGEYVREWKETPYTMMDGVPMIRAGQGPIIHKSSQEAAFAIQLGNRLNDMFRATFAAARGHGFDDVFLSYFPDRASIRSVDLLGYIRPSRQSSFLPYNQVTGLPLNATGVTQPLPTGVISEVWLLECNYDIGAVANVMYHEFMHNKTRYATNEDALWVHGHEGGGGLASAETYNAVAQLTDLNMRAMAKRLTIQNQQYLDKIPMRPPSGIRR